MSIKALFWAASESLQCLHVYIVCPQIMLPYSSLEQMKDLKIQTARFVHMSWNSVYLLYTFLHLLVMYSMWSVKVRSSSMTTSSTHWEGTFLSGVPLMLNGIGGEARYSFCCRKSSMLFHGIYRNTPFRTPGLEINDSYLHVKYSMKNVGLDFPKCNIISIFGFSWFREA